MPARHIGRGLLAVVLVASSFQFASASVAYAGGTSSSGAATGQDTNGDTTTRATVDNGASGGSNGPRPGADGKDVCTPWSEATLGEGGGFLATSPPPKNAVGVADKLFTRSCPDAAGVLVAQWRWVPVVAGVELMPGARDEVIRRLPKPVLVMAPPVDHEFVNVESFFGVQESPAETATATAGGVSATVVATPVSLVLQTGSKVAGDTTVVRCGLWGSTTASVGGCSWTPRFPSVSKVTGTDDYAYHGSVSVVWHVTWSSTDGMGGDLGDVNSTSGLLLQVREIQTG